MLSENRHAEYQNLGRESFTLRVSLNRRKISPQTEVRLVFARRASKPIPLFQPPIFAEQYYKPQFTAAGPTIPSNPWQPKTVTKFTVAMTFLYTYITNIV